MRLKIPTFQELLNAFPQHKPLVKALQTTPGNVGIFGGAVRDTILGVEPHDLDVLVMDPHAVLRDVCLSHGLDVVHFTPGRGATPLPTNLAEACRIPNSALFYSGGGVEVSSAPNIYGWVARPLYMDRCDFTINNIVVWDDGLQSMHPQFVHDTVHNLLRPVNTENVSLKRTERFLSMGFRHAE